MVIDRGLEKAKIATGSDLLRFDPVTMWGRSGDGRGPNGQI
jgi:hypothetical protein